MSTLTKILIVLLTLSSIFLCGIVVTYVAHANNYRELYETEKKLKQEAVNQKTKADEDLRAKTAQYQKNEDDLTRQINLLTSKLDGTQAELLLVKAAKAELDNRVQSWVSITQQLTKSTDEQGKLLEKTLQELADIRNRQITQGKQLDEATTELIAKMAMIESLEKVKRQLEEERAELQKQLNRMLLPVGREAAPVTPITPEPPPVRPVPAVVKPIELNGAVTDLDLKLLMAEISLGSAHGVREGMRFYVTRGSDFVCEILITDVEPEKAIGILERLKPAVQPRTGDRVSTNL